MLVFPDGFFAYPDIWYICPVETESIALFVTQSFSADPPAAVTVIDPPVYEPVAL